MTDTVIPWLCPHLTNWMTNKPVCDCVVISISRAAAEDLVADEIFISAKTMTELEYAALHALEREAE